MKKNRNILYIRINVHPKLKEVVLKEAGMGKNRIEDRPKFIYYRLLRGIQNMFTGVKRLFSFILKKKHRQKIKEEMLIALPLFRGKYLDESFWLDVAA